MLPKIAASLWQTFDLRKCKNLCFIIRGTMKYKKVKKTLLKYTYIFSFIALDLENFLNKKQQQIYKMLNIVVSLNQTNILLNTKFLYFFTRIFYSLYFALTLECMNRHRHLNFVVLGFNICVSHGCIHSFHLDY